MDKIAPILIITFNRPDYLRALLDVVQDIDTSCLYIFRDGPRKGNQNDIQAGEDIKDEIKKRTFSFPVKTNFSEQNYGCGYGPYNAISWAFTFEEQLIILEDDCIPSPVFFNFCTDMLDQYKNHNNVRLISGRSHYSHHPIFKKYDYIFSQYAHTLGWATWKRVWNGFSLDMPGLDDFLKKDGFRDIFATSTEAHFMQRRYKKVRNDKNLSSHSWDIQFGFYCRRTGALGIVPSKNLVRNIGYIGTHPSKEDSYLYTLPAETIFSYGTKEPLTVSLNKEYELSYFKKFIKKQMPSIYVRVLNKIKRICS